MGFFGDEDEAFDLFVLHELDKQSKKSGGCMLSLLVMLALPAAALAGAIWWIK